jgi:arylsulfate sulfotransferase
MERLENGNLYFGHYNAIFEMQWDGTIVNTWPFPYRFHHNVQEMPNGNFLVTVSNPDATHQNGTRTVEDHIIEIERSSGGVIKIWDLREILDEHRVAWANELQTNPIDWAHANAVIYDANDNTIIVSCRKQGLLKVDYEDNIKWILGPHKGWNQNRKGEDLNQFLLQPLDANGAMINNQEVMLGNQNHPDFEWSWYQHAPLILDNGHLLVFDNGDNRNFNFEGPYSRAVEYAINAENKTIQQIWSYGKERGAATYSHIVSDVDFLSQTGNVLFAPGAILSNGEWKGKIVEVNPITNQVVFEVNINSGVYITFHRVERMEF